MHAQLDIYEMIMLLSRKEVDKAVSMDELCGLKISEYEVKDEIAVIVLSSEDTDALNYQLKKFKAWNIREGLAANYMFKHAVTNMFEEAAIYLDHPDKFVLESNIARAIFSNPNFKLKKIPKDLSGNERFRKNIEDHDDGDLSSIEDDVAYSNFCSLFSKNRYHMRQIINGDDHAETMDLVRNIFSKCVEASPVVKKHLKSGVVLDVTPFNNLFMIRFATDNSGLTEVKQKTYKAVKETKFSTELMDELVSAVNSFIYQ